MKNYSADKIRNVGIFGHGGEGKTMLSEAMLYAAGVISRMGTDGKTVSDYDEEEKKRGQSFTLSVLPLEWNGTKINLVDAPGDFDFAGEVTASMELVDSALIVVGAISGPVVGAEKAMALCKKAGKPRMIVVNQMDKENASFDKTVEAIREKFGTSAVPIMIPMMEGTNYKGYVDIVAMNAKMFDQSGNEKEVEIPANMKDAADEIRAELVEAAAGVDEALMEKFFAEEEITAQEVITALATGIETGEITPICATAAVNCTGVKTLLNNIVHYLPTADKAHVPAAVDAKTGEPVEIKLDGKFAARVVKSVVADTSKGKFSIMRVYSGQITKDLAAYNANKGETEKAASVYMLRGKDLVSSEPEAIVAGDIGVMVKLQYTDTGDTLCDASAPVKFEEIKFPHTCISLAISAQKQGEEDKVFSNLRKLAEEDPTIEIEKNAETGDVLLKGLGEKHLDVVCTRLKNRYKADAVLNDPRIPYRETIRGEASAEGKHKKQSGGAGQFGVVNMKFEPLNNGEEYEFVNAIVGGVVPKEFIPAVEKGLVEAMKKGVIAGYPMVGVKATLFDGKYHPVDSKEVAFKSAARLSFKAACASPQAKPVLTEPVYSFEIHVPDEYMGDIMGDMSRRRGRVLGMQPHQDGGQVVSAEAPLSEMFKYATDLRSMTQGRGSFTMKFERYEDVPSDVAKKIIENAKLEEEEDD